MVAAPTIRRFYKDRPQFGVVSLSLNDGQWGHLKPHPIKWAISDTDDTCDAHEANYNAEIVLTTEGKILDVTVNQYTTGRNYIRPTR